MSDTESQALDLLDEYKARAEAAERERDEYAARCARFSRKFAAVRELPEWCREEARLGIVTNPQRAFRMVAERLDAILDGEGESPFTPFETEPLEKDERDYIDGEEEE